MGKCRNVFRVTRGKKDSYFKEVGHELKQAW